MAGSNPAFRTLTVAVLDAQRPWLEARDRPYYTHVSAPTAALDLPGSTESGAARWRMLALIAVAELFGMSLWFTASALAPRLALTWDLSSAQAGALTTAVPLGFVAGTATAAVLNFADLFPARRYFAVSALLGAVANAALIAAGGYGTALALRFLTGFFLAGVYPPAMKMAATWFRSARGLAIGTIVGATTIGKATPYLIGAFPDVSLAGVVLSASAACVAGALLVAVFYHDGPFPFARRPFSWGLVGVVVQHRPTRLAIAGYLGHMWELYAMWSMVTLFYYDYFLVADRTMADAAARAGVLGFAVIAAGGAGSVLAGKWADRLGRERITIWAMAVSGACALLIGWMIAAPAWLVATIGIVWGFTVVADSAQFSALVTEHAPAHAVGTALTLQTSLGFLLTVFSISAAIAVQTRFGWPAAFGMLAVGPALGIWAMLRLTKLRAMNSANRTNAPV